MSVHHRYVFPAAAAALGLVLGTAGCGLFSGGAPAKTMVTSGDAPAGEGTVRASKGDNGNTKLEVKVKHLAPPSKLADDASVYVVWITPKNGETQNAGALEVGSDLEGKLETMTPHRAFEVTVTPEPSARVAKPTHKPVFRSDVDRTE